MRPDDAPVLALLRQSLDYYTERQQVLADNVANANTPGFTPRDISQDAFAEALASRMRGSEVAAGGVGMRTSQNGHLRGSAQSDTVSYRISENPDSETTINGNSVVLEDQMVRANENRMRYEAALSIYQKNISILRTALRPPGR